MHINKAIIVAFLVAIEATANPVEKRGDDCGGWGTVATTMVIMVAITETCAQTGCIALRSAARPMLSALQTWTVMSLAKPLGMDVIWRGSAPKMAWRPSAVRSVW